MAMYLIVYGYVCNFMSTEMTVEKPETYLDSIDHFLKPDHDHPRKPILMRGMYFDSALQRALKGSKLDQLYTKRVANCDHCYITINTIDIQSNANSLIQLWTQELLGSTAAFIYPQFIAIDFLRQGACAFRPELILPIHFSNKPIASGNLHTFLSWSLPVDMLAFVEYKMATFMEFKLIDFFMGHAMSQILTESGLLHNFEYYQCMEPIVERDSTTLDSISLESIKPGLILIHWLLIVATCVMVLEVVIYRLMVKCSRWRSRKSRN